MPAFSYTALFLGWLLLAQTTSAEILSGRPSRIISGDQLILTSPGNRHQVVRLLGIQAPSQNRRMWRAARRHLSSIVSGRPVDIEYHNSNRRGHIIGKIFLGGADINLRMLQSGLAKHDPTQQTRHDRHTYAQAMRQAQQQGLGIWSRTPSTPSR